MENYFCLKQYLENPLGKGSSFVPGIHELKGKYNQEYEFNKRKYSIKWFFHKRNKELIAHVIVPSKSSDTLTYDVVLSFDISEKGKNVTLDDGKTIMNFPLQVFSNCPSFVYTFAHAFNSKKILISWLIPKYDSLIIKMPPKIRNPYELLSYEKSLYLSMLYIMKTYNYIYENIKPLEIRNYKSIFQDIRSQKNIEDLYALGKIKKEETTQEKKQKEKTIKKELNKDKKKSVTGISKVGLTKVTKTTNKTKRQK